MGRLRFAGPPDLSAALHYGDHGIPVDLNRFRPSIDAILKALVERDLALEVNTSGLRQAIGRTMPELDIVARFKSSADGTSPSVRTPTAGRTSAPERGGGHRPRGQGRIHHFAVS